MRDYDYSQEGAYFITICTQNRVQLFGEIMQREMHLDKFGKIAQEVWEGLSSHYPHIELDAFVVMPNHVHGIICLTDETFVVGAG